MVVGEDAAGLVAADGVEERRKDGQGVPVLAGGKVLNPLVDVGVSSPTRPRRRGGVTVCSGWEVHALREACFQEPVMMQSWPLVKFAINRSGKSLTNINSTERILTNSNSAKNG